MRDATKWSLVAIFSAFFGFLADMIWPDTTNYWLPIAGMAICFVGIVIVDKREWLASLMRREIVLLPRVAIRIGGKGDDAPDEAEENEEEDLEDEEDNTGPDAHKPFPYYTPLPTIGLIGDMGNLAQIHAYNYGDDITISGTIAAGPSLIGQLTIRMAEGGMATANMIAGHLDDRLTSYGKFVTVRGRVDSNVGPLVLRGCVFVDQPLGENETGA